MTDKETFIERWNSYVDDFDRLRLSLPPEEVEKLDRIKDELYDLIEAGAENAG